MKNRHIPMRLASMLLVLALFVGLIAPANATSAASSSAELRVTRVDDQEVSASVLPHQLEEVEETHPADTEMTRVSIVLEKESTLDAGFSTENIASNHSAMAYRAGLKQDQAEMQAKIEKTTGEKLDVVWNLTLAANAISANVEYGQIAEIEKVPGVKSVYIEDRYDPAVVNTELEADPNMSTSSSMIGSSAAYALGYTGAGSRIAVIDTGIDTDHQSFDAGAFEHSLEEQAAKNDKTVADYNLLKAQEIRGKLSELHLAEGITAEDLYVNAKIPFGYNYVDGDLDITHDNDKQGEHGSHVEGIAAANTYIPDGNGGYTPALSSVFVQGVAPDAQLIVMKVFGKDGGAYESDYMVAVEDAIVLDCDAVNMSLGAPNPGNTRHQESYYQAILDNLASSDIVMTVSAGNAGAWPTYGYHGAGLLYHGDVSMQTAGTPGTYTNALTVASADNAGTTGAYFTVGTTILDYVFYRDGTGTTNQPLNSIPGTHEYVLIDGFGTEEEFAKLAPVLKGKIAICSRGTTPFLEKANAAVKNGAIATIIYNNEEGVIGIDLTGYTGTAPVVSITQAEGEMLKDRSTMITDDNGKDWYYSGTLTIAKGIGTHVFDDPYVMSDFSSWGVPGSLKMKPEITAPGGNIYSVNGIVPGGKAYETMSGTSMAAPQIAGMTALVAQYIREKGLDKQTGLSPRVLAQSLLMSTAVPMAADTWIGKYWSVLQQGAGLANVGNAVSADSYILMDENATDSYADGKVKAELGECKFQYNYDGVVLPKWNFSFNVHNLTDTEKTYDLEAKLFTQSVGQALDSSNEKVTCMQEMTSYFNATTTFTAGGEKVTAVTVPANGSVQVDVSITMSRWDLSKQLGGEITDIGCYLEGFVFVKGRDTAEGLKGTEHSIPLLGYMGSWSDPSMFDVGTYAEYQSDDETRKPYLGSRYNNCFGVTYGGSTGVYAYGGNPIVPDAHYLPERNAFNNERGDTITSVVFSNIRNAVGARFQLKNDTANTVVATSDFNQTVDAAFYYELAGAWYNLGYNVALGDVVPSGSEGDKLTASWSLALEYYQDEKGFINWDAMGKGASISVPMVIDNTAPELVGENPVVINEADKTLTVTARDNQYVAGVVLFNSSGTKDLLRVGAVQDATPNVEEEYVMDISKINGTRFLLQVYDYAMNKTTYVIDQTIGDPTALPDMIAYNLHEKFWVSLNTSSTREDLGTAYAEFPQIVTAATLVDHFVFASTANSELYVMPDSNLSDATRIAWLPEPINDMTYNDVDGQIYGVLSESVLVTVDKLTGKITTVGKIGPEGFDTLTLACDGEGTFYCNKYDTADVYKFTLDTMDAPEKVATVWDDTFTSFNASSMEVDPNNGHLMWCSYAYIWTYGGAYRLLFSYIFEIHPENDYYVQKYNDVNYELTGLLIPDKSQGPNGSWADPADKVEDILLSRNSIELWKGSTESLSAVVHPWTALDQSVTWTSSDESIAKVDTAGNVTAVSSGVCDIIATSRKTPEVSVKCTVTVNNVPVSIMGVMQDADGNPMTFSWDLENDETWTAGIPLDSEFVAAGYDPVNDKLYVQDDNRIIHKIDPSTGKTEQTANSPALWDMQYSTTHSTEENPLFSCIYEGLFYPCKDPMFIGGQKINATQNLSGHGASAFVAMTCVGTETYMGATCDRYIVLDDKDGLWNINIYYGKDESGVLGYYSAGAWRCLGNLKETFPGYGGNKFSSMATAEDGSVYLSAFDGKTSKLYRIDLLDARDANGQLILNQCTYKAHYLTDFGSNVWPVSLCEVSLNGGTCTHYNKEIRGYIDPTCTQEGYSGDTYCVDCGKLLAKGSALESLGHDMGQWAVTQEPTCYDTGIETRTCSRCDYSESREIPALPHEYQDEIVKPDCESDGYTQHTCERCGHNYRDNFTPALGHEYTEKVVEATCDTAGYTEHTCNRCEHSYMDNLVQPLGHDYKAVVTAPTHDKMGYTTYTCTREGCGHSYVGDYTDALGHTYTQTVTKEATCTEEGVMTFTCDCGKSYTQPISKTEHQYDSVVKEPDCTHMGYTTHTCTVCGSSYQDAFVDATGHDCEATVVEPTCTGYGYTEHACKHCDYHYTSDIRQPLGHKGELRLVKEATCTEDGYTGDMVCTVCGETIQTGKSIPATGHSFGEWEVSKAATCAAPGEETRTCAHCQEQETRELPALDHTFGEWTITQQADCFHDGLKVHTCTVCGQEETEVVEKNSENCPSKAFSDLDCSQWYHEGVDFMITREFMKGVSGTLFQPNGTLTRGQLVTILHRMAGTPEAKTKAPFTDVVSTQYFFDAVAWAYETKIAEGVSGTAFAPNAPVTREQLVTFLYRYAQYQEVDVSTQGSLAGYPDTGSLDAYAQIPMAWAVEEELVYGMDGKLNPKGTATRAQIATIIQRYCTTFGK